MRTFACACVIFVQPSNRCCHHTHNDEETFQVDVYLCNFYLFLKTTYNKINLSEKFVL